MKNKRIPYLIIISLVFVNCGCASRQTYIQKESPAKQAHLINNVPFFKQTLNTCGPAALASILKYWKVDFNLEDMTRAVYSPQLKGSIDFELSYYARQFNLWSQYYQTNLEDLKQKLKKNLPLIVIQKDSLFSKNYHYIVVFGFDDNRGEIIAHIGDKANARIAYRRFLKIWKRGDFGVILICPPEKVSWPLVDAQSYIYLGYLFEKKDAPEKAAQAYLKATSIEPGSKIAYFNLGNAYFKLEMFQDAEKAFRKAIKLDADFADAYNNLAYVYLYLSDNNKLNEAEVLVNKALELNPKNREYYLDTLNRIKQRLGGGG